MIVAFLGLWPVFLACAVAAGLLVGMVVIVGDMLFNPPPPKRDTDA